MKKLKLMEKKDGSILTNVNAWNNQLKHYKIDVAEDDVSSAVGAVLEVMIRMLEEMEIEPTEHIDRETFVEIEHAVCAWEDVLDRAGSKVMSWSDPKEGLFVEPSWCSECDENYVDENGYCHLCRQDVGISECTWCGSTTVEVGPFGECDVCAHRHDDE